VKKIKMIFYSKSKNKVSGLLDGIKKFIDDILIDIEEKFGPKLKPIKIKSNKMNIFL
jgi:hypothetical protein